MSESTLKPFTGKLDDNTDKKQQPALKPFTGVLDGEDKGFLGQVKDHAVSFFGKSAVALGETAVGLSDMMSDGATGKILSEKLGYDPKAAKNVMTGWQSEQYQQQLKDSANIGNRKIEEGDDFATKVGKKFDNAVDITKNAINNPSLITNTVAESLPSMFLGGVLGRASGIANPVVAGAVGEGAVMAGSQAEQIRQETVDGRLTADQSLAGVGTGALGGLIGFAGGRLAQKMGIGDVDTMLVTGRAGPADIAGEIASMPAKSLPRRVIEGAISEGFLEELPQSVSEQVIQNLALDKPWHDGIEDAAVMGTLAGMAMGGAANILSDRNTSAESQDNQQQSGSPNLPSAPPQLGSNPDSALTGEYIPRGNVPQGDNQGRTAFVYDQPSMDADNLLNNNYKGDTGFDTSGNFGPSNNPDSPLSPSGGNYFDDHASQSQPQLPSERLGINPNDGPMSSAAALAVDSGASPIAQLGYTPEQQSQEQSNTPLSDAVPSNYQSLLGSQNNAQSFNANLEDATVQQGNTQVDNAGKSISQQYDTNAADAMGGGIETDGAKKTTAQTVQPILGQDGKNKWFGTQDKAQAFIDKKDLGNDYQVVQDGKRFEIQPKSQVAQTQNVDTLPKTESANQDDVPNPYNENQLRANVRHLSLQASKEAQAQNAEDSKYIANLGNTASARANEKVKQQFPELYKRAEELAKTAEITSAGRRGNTHFSSLSFKGDSSFVSGDPWPKRPTRDEILQQAIWHLSQDDNNGTPKNVKIASKLTELEQQLANEKSVPKKAQIRKQIAELQNGLTEQAQSTVSLNQPENTVSEDTFESENPNGKAPSPTEQKIRETLQRNDTQQNGKKMESAATILANQIKRDGAEYFTLGWNKDAQLTAEARDYVETILDETLSNLSIKGFDDADSFSKLTNDVLESIDDVYATADDSSWDNRPVKDKDGNYNAPKLVKVKDEKGRTRYVLEHELNNPNVEYLHNFTESGRRSVVKISRENIFQDTPQNEQDASLEIEKKADAPKAQADAPKAEPEQKKVKVSENKFVTDERRAELEKRIKAKLSQLNSGVDPELIVLGTELALYHIERGVRTFAAYARAMSESLGDNAKPYLKSWYMGVKYDPRATGFDGMSSAAEVENFDLDDLDLDTVKIKDQLADVFGNDVVTISGDKSIIKVGHNGYDTHISFVNSPTIHTASVKQVEFGIIEKDHDNLSEVIDHIKALSKTSGKTETVVTPSGREFEVRHKIVEADDLITSNLDSGAVNTEYPQALQPRDRTTLKSVTQINDIANKLNPKLLGDSASSTNGAPIVSPDNEVESGNGRTLAIRKAYQTGKADAYKAWLAEQGYDVANMQQPILVRERITRMNRVERLGYITESNERDTLDMSPSEQAMSDAPKVMDILHLVQGGSFNNTANRDFVNAFLTGVASKNERGTMLDKDGVSLTQDGYRRIEAALLAAAFNDAQIISQVIESKDSDIKAIGNALIEVAPQWAQVRKGVQEGILVEGVNVEANLVEAVHLIRKARQQNLSLSEMLNQDDMFDGGIDQVTKDFVGIFYRGDKLDKARSSQKVAEALKSYAQLAMTAKASPNLFGDAPLSTEQILGQVHDRLKQSEAEKQQDIFSSQGNDDTGNGKPSETGQGPASSQSNAATPKSDTAVTRPTVERPKNDTTLVQDWGVQYVDGWATNSEHKGKIYTDNGLKDGVKAAFLKDSKKYLEAVQKNLEGIGYELHLDKKGKPQKVSVKESGVGVSGEVSLYIREPVTGTNVYVSIGDGRPGSHPQRIGILYRATMKESDKQASGFGIENSGNQYAGANTSAFELAQMIDDMVTALVKRNQNKENSNEQTTTSVTASTSGQSRQDRSANAANAMADNAENEAVSTQSSDDLPSTNERSNGSRQSGSTRTSTSRKNKSSTGSATGTGATTASSTKRSDKPITAASGRLDEKIADDLATKVEQANPDITDFVITDNSSIGKGSLEQKFNDNIAAIQTVHKLDAENRLATPEERQIIARYIGWGGLSNAFDENAKGWEAKAKLLKSLLSEDDYKNAINTVNSAFFTPTTVTRSMWDMVQKLGFKGGLVLEPSVGVGNFLGVSPKGMQNKFIGVEYDGITSRIAQHLYPSSTIIHSGYEAMPLADNMFDLVIANPPYGSQKEIFKTKPHLNKFSIHNQFIIGNIENLKPNGIAVIVVTHSFMDAADNSARKLVASMSNLVAAVRLPENTFKENANTNVITDILIFQKFDEATKAQFDEAKIKLFPDWVNSGTLESEDGQPMSFSNYFTKGKGKVIGKVVNTTNQFGGSTFTVKHDGNLKADLAQFVSELPLLIEPNTAKSIAQKAEIDFNNATSHMVLGSSNVEVGSVGRNSNGQLTRVVERENEFGGLSLVEEIITPDTVWSKSYSIDANGNYFKLVVALDEKGKPQKVLNKAGKPTNFNVYVRQIVPVDKIPTSSKLGERKYKALQALVSMRDLLKEQIRLERYGLEGMERNRKLLAKAYHDFVKPQKEGGYGFINAPYAAAIVNELPDAALLFSLEKSYKKEVKVVTGKDKIGKNILAVAKPAKATPADILSKQVLNVVSDITRADTIEDALAVSLSQTGKVDIDLIASLLESNADAVIKQLHDSRDNPLAFFDPSLNSWVPREKYLAGNVRQKLNAASNANLEKNIESLERVLPKTIPIENISLALGMEWIPESVYTKFASYITGDQNATVKFNHVLKEYAIEAAPTQEKALLFGTERMPPNSLLNHVMNSRSIIIRDYVKHSDGSTSSTVNQAQTEAAVTMAETVKNEFLQWIYGQQDIVEQLANVFNYVYNSMVLGKFDGSHLKFVGKVPDEIIKLRKHQIDGIWRGVTNSFVLYDHAVGSGKTFTGIARAIERKRLGLSKKPLMVVPNHMVEQFAADVYRLYPGANVLAAGRKKFTGENRRKLFARIATGDYDLIIVPHSSFSFMSMSSEFEEQFIEKQVDQVVDALREAENSEEGKRGMTVKRLRDLYAKLTSRLEKRRNAIRKDRMITFEEMGIDDITVDEAHEFKNLFYNTNLKGIVGLGQTSGSNKAFDLFMKFQYLHQMGYSGAFMTGTPISNSAVEMHAMMRYIIPNELEQLGLESFDSWQKMFANNTAKFEATESGQLKLKSRFARDWKNMSVLMNSWYTVVDPVTNEDVKRVYKEIEGKDFPLPRVKGGSRQSVVVAPDQYQEMLLAEVLDGFAGLEDISDPKEKAAERFRLFDKAKKLSLDARSVNPIEYADAEGPKIKAVTASVFDLYKKWNKDKGTQIIFLDRSVPKSKGDEKQIKEYDELVNKMEQAERDGDDDLMLEISEKLDKYDSNEINEMRIAAQGGWTAYDEIKRQLIAKGIPADEIAFIHDANNDEEKQALFEKVKSGEVRVLIGNTPRMGAGTNVQDRLVGLHHVDVTWKPSDIEQREGRIIRQGNLLYEKYGHDNFEVVINAYVTERTMDAKLWDINSAKLKTINGIRNYNGEYEMDFGQDADAISMQEIAAIASGDPLMLERVELDAEIQALQREQQQHERRQSSFISQVSKANQEIQAIPAIIKALQDSQKRHDQIYDRVLEKFNSQEITIDGEKFDSRDSAELYVRTKYDSAKQKAGEGEKVSVTYKIDGQNFDSMTRANEYIKNGFAMRQPIEIEYNGQTFNDSTDMMSDMFAQNGDKLPSLFKSERENAMTINGIPVDIDVDRDGFNFVMYAEDGTTEIQVLGSQYMHFKDATALRVANLINAIAKGLSKLDQKIAGYEQRLQSAKDVVKGVSDKIGQAFAKQDVLDAKKERLESVLSQLNAENSNDTKEDGPLYSRKSGNQKTGKTIAQVREALINRFGKDVIEELERQGKLEIIQDYDVDGIEGFYKNGKAVLVASNLTAESTIPTFLHELGGHAGFQNMMTNAQYNELMKQFDKLVEQGNPVAIAAKELAEREQGLERQQLEYLPYLLTLASTMQQKNVLQRNALQRLIRNLVSHVKAWLFDKFGINLNLNPDDMVALAERMVAQATQAKANTNDAAMQFSSINPAKAELDAVRKQYENTPQWMKAPNGKPTNLNEQQWLQVRTPSFKKWFGDWENGRDHSIVTDGNDEPMTVRHYTNAEFDKFDISKSDGFWFTDKSELDDNVGASGSGVVKEVFLNIRDPDTNGPNSNIEEYLSDIDEDGIINRYEDYSDYAVINPEQIKSATDNIGTFNSENADIRFSRVDLSGSINRLSKSFKQASAQSTNQWLKNKAKDTLGIALQALTRRQIMDVYGKLLPQLHRYNHIVELMDADATETSVNADNIVNEWADLKDEQQLAELMHEATLAKIDPAKPFVSGSGTSISKYAQLRKVYDALTPEAQAMYVKARDAYSKHYADVHQAIKERILRSELSNQKKTDLLKQMDDNFFAQSKGVYFPLSRFGKYVVVVRDANNVVESVNRAETLNEAEAVRIELQKQFPNSKVSPVTKDKEFNASRDGVGRGFMSELFKEAGNLGLSAKDQADFEDTLSQLYLASMPDLSWAKHGIHRKGMAGFSQNARRAFAQNMLHGGSYLAKLRYGDQLAEQLDSMKKTVEKEIDANPDYDQVTARNVYEEMEKRHESYMNPKPHPVSTALTSLGFVYYLGLSPAAAMVNLSQTALVAYPLMGAKFGFKKSAAALKAAMADFAKGVDVKNRNLDITKSLNTDEKKAYEEALRRGVIDKTQVHSLAGVAQGEDSGLSEKLKPIMKWSSFMFHHAERFNREVTFVASYRLAKEHSIVENGKPRKLTNDEALEMAIDMTYKGHFDYSAGNRARFMQGNVAKVVLLFKQFAQNMIFTLMRQAYLSMYGMDVNERNEARKALAAILAFHGMAAGLLGLPIATSLVAASFLIAKKNPMLGMLFGAGAAAVFFGAGGDDDDPWDLEVEIRNYAAEVLGDDLANYLMKGAPRALGIDLSGRVGLDNLVIPKVQDGLEGQNLSNSIMAGALGPVAGIGANLFKGGQELGDGNLGRAMEAMLPVFMKNPIKAMRYADEGVQDKTGISIQDEVDAWGVFNQTIGFSPADVRLAYEGRSAIYQKKNRLTERRGELMSMWSRARKQDDQEEMDAIWEEIQAFNEKNPSLRITRINLNQSYRQRQRRIDRAEDGVYLPRNRQDARDAGYFAFGE